MQIEKDRLTQLIKCDQILHNWARILGQVGYKLVPFQPDHGHANFAWNSLEERLDGREFIVNGKPYFVSYSVDESAFIISKDGKVSRKIETKNKAGKEVIHELETDLTQLNSSQIELQKGLEFRFPSWFDEQGLSAVPDSLGLQLWKIVRTGANEVLKSTLRAHKQSSEIRIWATNFDTGIFCDFGNGMHQYAGLASADKEVVNQLYFYNSFYKNNERIYPSDFPKLENGYWEAEKWAGAVLPISLFEASRSFITAAEEFLVNSTDIFLNNNKK